MNYSLTWKETVMTTSNDVGQLSVEQRKMLASIIADKQLWHFSERDRWRRALRTHKQLGYRSSSGAMTTFEQGVAEQEHNIEMLHQIISILRLAKFEDIDDRRED